MAKVTPITEQFQHFVRDLKESFWGDPYGKTPLAWPRLLEEESRRARDRYLVADSYERERKGRRGSRNGYYVRDFVTRLGTLRVRADGSRQLLSFLRSRGESQAAWEGLLMDLYRRGLEGRHLQLMVTDGGPELAAALQTVYPQVPHQRCWVHKMRNILEKVRKRDHDQVKADAQAIYLAESRQAAPAAFRLFRSRWRSSYPAMVKRLERDLPELLSFFSFPRHLWKKLRTTNVIARCFVEVRRRTCGE